MQKSSLQVSTRIKPLYRGARKVKPTRTTPWRVAQDEAKAKRKPALRGELIEIPGTMHNNPPRPKGKRARGLNEWKENHEVEFSENRKNF